MAEAVYKSGRRKGFTTVYRSVAQDRRLSLKARGLFLLLQSLPEDWSYTQTGLAHVAGVGRDQLRSALKELETVGYLTAEQSHDEAGKFSGAVYVLREEVPEEETPEAQENLPLPGNPTTVEDDVPLSENPSTGNPMTENPSPENPQVQNNNIKNNNKHTPLTPQGAAGAASSQDGKGKPPKTDPKWKPQRFRGFWDFYRTFSHGKQGPRQTAVKAWDKLKADDATIDCMAHSLARFFAGDMQQRGIGIPYAATWLNQRRWENDEPDAQTGPDPQYAGGHPELTLFDPGGYAL